MASNEPEEDVFADWRAQARIALTRLLPFIVAVVFIPGFAAFAVLGDGSMSFLDQMNMLLPLAMFAGYFFVRYRVDTSQFGDSS